MDWNKEFSHRNFNEKLNFLTSCILNIFQIFCLSTNIIVECKDAPWMTNKIKSLLTKKTKLYKQYMDDITAHVSKLISETKQNYLANQSNKLNDKYWSILNTFLNKRKIPMLQPIVFDDGFVNDVGEKVNIFNNCFADQCTPIDNGSRLPLLLPLKIKVTKD